jgi:hypothetical protein
MTQCRTHIVHRMVYAYRLRLNESVGAVALVVPKETIPNQRSGILLGQTLCIYRLLYRSIPRRLLQVKGENVKDNI